MHMLMRACICTYRSGSLYGAWNYKMFWQINIQVVYFLEESELVL